MKKLILLSIIPLFLFSKEIIFEPWGKDADLLPCKSKKDNLKSKSLLTKIANSVIVFHQKVISPVDGPRSHFRPTSSRYMQLAMQRYGFFKGYIMGCDRLLRENNEKWVYRTITMDEIEYKFDPAQNKKFINLR